MAGRRKEIFEIWHLELEELIAAELGVQYRENRHGLSKPGDYEFSKDMTYGDGFSNGHIETFSPQLTRELAQEEGAPKTYSYLVQLYDKGIIPDDIETYVHVWW